jgi:hypothetical protein
VKKQEWVCEVCGLSGAIEHTENADVMSIVHQLEDHHDRLASKLAPHCRFNVHKVRIRNSELMDIYEWNRLVASLERKCNA